jgi:hypothetical protein
MSEEAGESCGIRAWCAADEGLIDIDDFVDVGQPLNGIEDGVGLACAVQAVLECGQQGVDNAAGFS